MYFEQYIKDLLLSHKVCPKILSFDHKGVAHVTTKNLFDIIFLSISAPGDVSISVV